MSVRNWLRTRHRLHEDLRLLNIIIADHEQTIVRLNEEVGEAENVTEIRVGQLQESLNLADRAFDQLTEMLIEREAKFARVVEELKALREEIREAEGNLPSAAGAGMARPPRPRFDRTAARLRQQGVPADLVEAIDEETAMKRQLDGLGD